MLVMHRERIVFLAKDTFNVVGWGSSPITYQKLSIFYTVLSLKIILAQFCVPSTISVILDTNYYSDLPFEVRENIIESVISIFL